MGLRVPVAGSITASDRGNVAGAGRTEVATLFVRLPSRRRDLLRGVAVEIPLEACCGAESPVSFGGFVECDVDGQPSEGGDLPLVGGTLRTVLGENIVESLRPVVEGADSGVRRAEGMQRVVAVFGDCTAVASSSTSVAIRV